MRDWQVVRWKNTVFASLALAAFALAERSFAVLVLAVGIALASWVITAGGRRRMLPVWAVVTLLVMTFAIALSGISRETDPADIPPLIGLVVAIALVVRLYARRTLSDERQVLMLAGVLVVAAALQSSDLLVGIMVFGATLAAVGCVIRFRLVSSGSGDGSLLGAPGILTSLELPVQSRARRGELRRVIRIALVMVLFLTLLTFVIFPRSIKPTGALFGMSAHGERGFPDRISLLTPQRIDRSERELLAMEWQGPDGIASAIAETIRLRGLTLDRYDREDAQWVSRRSASQRFVIGEAEEFETLGLSAIDERFSTCTARIWPQGLQTDVIFSPWAPIAIRSANPQTFTFAPTTMTLRTLDTDALGLTAGYEIRVQLHASESTLAALQGGSVRIPALPTFPVPAIREEALAILDRSGDAGAVELAGSDPSADPENRWTRNRRLARAFEEELRSERFRYTLDLRSFALDPVIDPIELFLTKYRFGHCEYFASALCALCQSIGVDARIVTGFLVDKLDSASGRYIVRESDAHAWVEVRTGLSQWTMIDATPASDEGPESPAPESWAQVLRFLYSPIESIWRDHIAQFDARAQTTLVNRFNAWSQGAIQRAWESVAATAREASASSQVGASGYVWIASIAVTLCFAISAAALARRRFRRAQRALGLTRFDRLHRNFALRDGAFYVDALDLLAQRGLVRPANLLPRAFALRVSAAHLRAGSIFGQVVERFYAIRFGGQRPDACARRADRQLVVQLREALLNRHQRG